MPNRENILDALAHAQRIAFGPILFQAVQSAVHLGILQAISDSAQGLSAVELANRRNLSTYTVQVLVELLSQTGVLRIKDNRYMLSKVGECLLFDPMTRVNCDFVGDVCYRAMDHLEQSLVEGKPVGLKELGPWETIYPHLNELPTAAKKAWFHFDHFYSDSAFRACARWLKEHLHPLRLFDVGGNTGKFAKICLETMPELRVTLIDLPQQCRLAHDNLRDAARFDTAAVNWLDPHALPALTSCADVIWMSQFLDCFSREQAVSILTRLKENLAPEGCLAILECLWDRQRFAAAKESLLSTSLYFTAVANGNSRFFCESELREIIQEAGYRVQTIEDDLGISHSLVICRKA